MTAVSTMNWTPVVVGKHDGLSFLLDEMLDFFLQSPTRHISLRHPRSGQAISGSSPRHRDEGFLSCSLKASL